MSPYRLLKDISLEEKHLFYVATKNHEISLKIYIGPQTIHWVKDRQK